MKQRIKSLSPPKLKSIKSADVRQNLNRPYLFKAPSTEEEIRSASKFIDNLKDTKSKILNSRVEKFKKQIGN